MAVCANCGANLQPGTSVCGRCGAQVNATSGSIPRFEPPSGDIPRFTPPSSPRISYSSNGPVCFHHPNEPAAGQCARCGKYICKDCTEAYGVQAGEYAGRCLCYDCCQELVRQNVEELTKNKATIKTQFIISLIGMAIGFICGLSLGVESGDFASGLVGGLVYACIGGVFLSALKAFLALSWEAIKIAFAGQFGWLTVISLFFNMAVIVFKCIFVTISNTIFYIRYLRETSGFIEADTAALQQMRDYMEYTQVLSNNSGVDLDTLMSEGSELYNNSYAQAVRDRGEAAADAELRQATTTIAENGEIIRSFH